MIPSVQNRWRGVGRDLERLMLLRVHYVVCSARALGT